MNVNSSLGAAAGSGFGAPAAGVGVLRASASSQLGFVVSPSAIPIAHVSQTVLQFELHLAAPASGSLRAALNEDWLTARRPGCTHQRAGSPAALLFDRTAIQVQQRSPGKLAARPRVSQPSSSVSRRCVQHSFLASSYEQSEFQLETRRWNHIRCDLVTGCRTCALATYVKNHVADPWCGAGTWHAAGQRLPPACRAAAGISAQQRQEELVAGHCHPETGSKNQAAAGQQDRARAPGDRPSAAEQGGQLAL